MFSIFDIVFKNIDGFAMFTPALTAVLLPLSGMWAAAKVESPSPSSATGLGSYRDVFGKDNEEMSIVGSVRTIGTRGHRRVDSGHLEESLSNHSSHVVAENFGAESAMDHNFGSTVGAYSRK
jgi:hypothetical protein